VKPKSLSASAAHVFELCQARYGAESYSRTPNSGSSAADLGTAVHEALDVWCNSGKMKDPSAPLLALLTIFDREYDKLFGDDQSRKQEGRDLCETWYNRTHPVEHEIISAEVKENFPIRVKHPRTGEKFELPFNYIWDRCDDLSDGARTEIDVVDYKTISWALNAEMMREKLQVRCYALAAMIKFPDAKRIWVTYDMLRHGDPLGVSFTRDDCIETYRYLQGLLIRILEADVNDLPETVNDECRWCIRKLACKAIRQHADVGGVHGITDVAEAAQRRLEMDQAQKAMKAAIDELDNVLMKHLMKEDELEVTLGGVVVRAHAQGRREVDAERVKATVPEAVWESYGRSNLKMGDYDKMLGDQRLTDKQRRELKKLVRKTFGAPSIKTQPAKTDEDD
jgi:hypothetical protein